jgi:hypothetical protein
MGPSLPPPGGVRLLSAHLAAGTARRASRGATLHWHGAYKQVTYLGNRHFRDHRHETPGHLRPGAGVPQPASPNDTGCFRRLGWVPRAWPVPAGHCQWLLGRWDIQAPFRITAPRASIWTSKPRASWWAGTLHSLRQTHLSPSWNAETATLGGCAVHDGFPAMISGLEQIPTLTHGQSLQVGRLAETTPCTKPLGSQ